MPCILRLLLKPGDRLFINGAIIRADRKVTIEVLNDVTFLLEHHFMSEEEANTPLRRLYRQAQIMLTEPHNRDVARTSCQRMLAQISGDGASPDIARQLRSVADLIECDKPFDALKMIRALYKADDRNFKPKTSPSPDVDVVCP